MHYPVLLKESIRGLNIKPNGLYIDGTFGRGGHSSHILDALDKGKLISFDRDPDAIAFGAEKFKHRKNFKLVHSAFSNIVTYCQRNHLQGKIDGILLDLGVSSPQLDEAERGFSFMKDGPLDMRMDSSQGTPVSDILKQLTREELTQVFKKYGEERYAWSIAGAIKQNITDGEEINTTLKLASIIEKQVSRKEKKHPATRCFQALRIYINEELLELEKTLESLKTVLAIGGRVSIISFHSLEDRIVKNFIDNEIHGIISKLPRGIPIPENISPKFKWVSKKVKPSSEELDQNIRSRSAILRVAERI